MEDCRATTRPTIGHLIGALAAGCIKGIRSAKSSAVHTNTVDIAAAGAEQAPTPNAPRRRPSATTAKGRSARGPANHADKDQNENRVSQCRVSTHPVSHHFPSSNPPRLDGRDSRVSMPQTPRRRQIRTLPARVVTFIRPGRRYRPFNAETRSTQRNTEASRRADRCTPDCGFPDVSTARPSLCVLCVSALKGRFPPVR